MRFGIIVFPGTWSERDCHYALTQGMGQQADYIWHRETDLAGYDALVLPGGFSYGDYLRCGAIARFSPIMGAAIRHASEGRLIIGICNGFQILCEAGLLPGVLMRNRSLQFRCEPVFLRAETSRSPFTRACFGRQVLSIPIAHGEGNYYTTPETLATLNGDDRVAFRYCEADGAVTEEANPNGSVENIAGILSEGRNVLGMMPHPERASEALLGGTDGSLIWRSMIEAFVGAA
jgi:phosphoribosylformylglycinamidine synthase subunit PurQ / glutaminase